MNKPEPLHHVIKLLEAVKMRCEDACLGKCETGAAGGCPHCKTWMEMDEVIDALADYQQLVVDLFYSVDAMHDADTQPLS